MVANIITVEDLDAFVGQLHQKITDLVTQAQNAPQGKSHGSDEVRRLRKISPGTLQTRRRNRRLPYTKVGGTMFYLASDIQKLLDDHKRTNSHRPPDPPAAPIPQRIAPVIPPKKPRVAQNA